MLAARKGTHIDVDVIIQNKTQVCTLYSISFWSSWILIKAEAHSLPPVCGDDLHGCTTHNQTSAISLPTQGTCHHCLHTHACVLLVYFMKKKVLSLSLFLMKLQPT